LIINTLFKNTNSAGLINQQSIFSYKTKSENKTFNATNYDDFS